MVIGSVYWDFHWGAHLRQWNGVGTKFLPTAASKFQPPRCWSLAASSTSSTLQN